MKPRHALLSSFAFFPLFVALCQQPPSRLPASALLSDTQLGFDIGFLVTQDDLWAYWDHTPMVGGFVRHVVAPQCAVLVSGTISYFEAKRAAPIGLPPDLLLLQTNVSCELSAPVSENVQLLIEPGLTTCSVAAVGSRAQSNLFTNVESEFGLFIGAGIRVLLWETTFVKVGATSHVVFTGPDQLQFYTVGLQVPFRSL